MIKIIKAASPKEIDEIRKLFLEYSSSLDFNLDFQNFENEVKNLPGEYSQPDGKLYLALYESKPAGCIAVRKIDKDYCEMKRLFVRPNFRGLKIGKALTEIIIHEATMMGYKFMRLDTFASMTSARKLYEEFGFKEIKPYRYNPIEGAVYMELNLRKRDNIDMNANDYLERSILFNPWKHHKNFICGQIKYYSSGREGRIKEFKKNLLRIGKSQMDFYLGNLLPEEIIFDISGELKMSKICSRESYYQWLCEAGNDYRNITLSDNSQWTLSLADDNEKFIHIHPARYSVHTVRVKAFTLQTAIAAIILSIIKSASAMDINIINETRKKYFGEPPVKAVYKNSGLGKIILLLEEER